jgi:hypothetical protein
MSITFLVDIPFHFRTGIDFCCISVNKDVIINDSRLGGVVVSVFATGLKGHGFEPGQSDGFKSHEDR